RCPGRGGQAGDAHVPVCTPFIWAYRPAHRGGTPFALARARDDPGRLRPRDAGGTDTNRHPQAFLTRGARVVRVAEAPGASARPHGLRPAAVAGAVRARTRGDGDVVDAPTGGLRRGSRPHGRWAGEGGWPGSSTRVSPPSASPAPPPRSAGSLLIRAHGS